MVDRPFVPVEVSSDESGGSFEKMLRRFVRRVRDEGRLSELYQRRFFVKPCQERRRRKTPSLGQKRQG